MKPKFSRWIGWAGAAALGLGMAGALAGAAHASDKKFKIFLSMSYIGNDWQAEAANMIKAMAQHKDYADKVDLQVQVAGPNAQRQIQQINAMVQQGAQAIVVYPISPTALNTLDESRPETADIVDAGVPRRRDRAVAPTFPRLRHVRLRQDTSLRQQSRRALARVGQSLQPLALVGARPRYIFLDRDLFTGHQSPPPRRRDGGDSEKHHRFKDAGD